MDLLDLLRQGPVTQQLSLVKLGLFRLAQAVNDLRNEGHEIKTVLKEKSGRVICEYHLKEK